MLNLNTFQMSSRVSNPALSPPRRLEQRAKGQGLSEHAVDRSKSQRIAINPTFW